MIDPDAPGFEKIRLTGDDLTFGELDQFAELTGEEFSPAVPLRKVFRALALFGLRRRGVDVTWDDFETVQLASVVDMDWYNTKAETVRAGRVDPTDAGA